MSRVNHNAQYIYDLEGETVWEKLRVVRTQLSQRKISLQLAYLDKEESESTQDKSTYDYRKKEILFEQTNELIQDCVNEIAFLMEFESALCVEAEKTRIQGKTDDEMYEMNFFDELKLRLVRSAQAQVLAYGRPTEETIRRVLKNKGALDLCITHGLLHEDTAKLANQCLLSDSKEYSILKLEAGS